MSFTLIAGTLPAIAENNAANENTSNIVFSENYIENNSSLSEDSSENNENISDNSENDDISVAEVSNLLSVEEGAPSAPKSITIKHNAKNVINDVIVAAKGDKFKLTAYDENDNETPVTWENTSYNGGGVSIDANTGEVEVTDDV